MSIPGSLTPLFNSGDSGYKIERSLRFNPTDSAYLNRTPASASNRRTWTISFWIKRSNTSTYQMIFQAGNANNVNEAFLYFVGDGISFYQTDGSGNTTFSARPTGVFRDYSAWYHIVLKYDSTQATSTDRVRYYINGVDRTDTTTSFPSLNFECSVNSTNTHRIGTRFAGIQYLGAYIADFQLIDGQALDSSYFGQFDSNGIWNPKKYSGSYGTNGFQINFSDNSNTTATTLGKDSSPNGNNWTPNNFSVSSGIGNDSMVDSPTNGTQVDTGLGGQVSGNYPTLNLNSIRRTPDIQNGSLYLNGGSANDSGATATMALPTTGKWYWDFTLGAPISNVYLCYSGLLSKENFPGGNYVNVPGALLYPRNGVVCFYDNTGAASCIGETASAGDVYGIAYNADTGLVDFYKNGVKYSGYSVTVTQGITYYPCLLHGNVDTYAHINFGQRPFAYPAPSGYKCLCDTNLPAPVVAKPSTAMDVKLYTGNGSTQTISGLNFSSDLIWIKRRDSSGQDHVLQDSVRGFTSTTKLSSSSTAQENAGTNSVTDPKWGYVTGASSTSFDITASTSGDQVNKNTWSYAAWCWDAGSSTVTNTQGSITSQVRANASAGFSIVTYTGTGANATVGHGLGVAPSMMLVKSRSAANGWAVYHASIGNTYELVLNGTSGVSGPSGTYWNSTSPTSTVFSLGTDSWGNASGGTYVAYCFTPVAGYSAFGSYIGNGSADGPFVYTGFRPRYLLWKSTSAGQEWFIHDTSRNPYNFSDLELAAQSSAAEYSASGVGAGQRLDFLSNGFKVRTSNNANNTNGQTFIYAAFAENPFQYARAR